MDRRWDQRGDIEMRVAAMVVGILFAIWIFFEALLVFSLFSAGNADEDAGLAAVGLVVAILLGLGAVLAIAIPHVSMVLFALGGLLSFAIAAGGYGNHWFYGIIGFMLAIFAFAGRRGQLKDRREKSAELQRQRERDARLEALIQQQTLAPCPSCGQHNPAGTRFCGNCGTALSTLVGDMRAAP
jgi:hypothetical protein